MPQKPVILDNRIVAESRIFRIERLTLRFANGTQTEYERLVGSAYGAVLIVPVLDAQTLLLIREYAAGTDRYELGFPKGRVEPGEDILEAANRELMEEVGHGARRLEQIESLSLAPGYLSHTTHIILARDLYPKRLPGDEPEEIEVVPWPLTRLTDLIAREDFSEGRSIAALFLAREILQPAGEP
jgi:ADP-ribose diphosphatase